MGLERIMKRAKVKCKKSRKQFTRKLVSLTRSVGSRSHRSLRGNRNEKFHLSHQVDCRPSRPTQSHYHVFYLFSFLFQIKLQLDEVNDSWLLFCDTFMTMGNFDSISFECTKRQQRSSTNERTNGWKSFPRKLGGTVYFLFKTQSWSFAIKFSWSS